MTFQYDERITSIKGLSFKVPAGKTYALVGSSGSGKTTIMRLVFRFYDVKTGRILIDGTRHRCLVRPRPWSALTSGCKIVCPHGAALQARTFARSHSGHCAAPSASYPKTRYGAPLPT